MKNSKSIQFKIAVVYIILFGAALFSGAYIFKELKRITLPEQSVIEESNKIFLVSSAITNLYASEATGRSAIITGSATDIKNYNNQLDSIHQQIDLMKYNVDDPYIALKLDTVQQLLNKKKQSFQEIVRFRKNINKTEHYDSAISEIISIKEKIEKNHQPIVETSEKQRKSLWSRLGQAFRAESSDTIKTTINYPKTSDSLVNAMEKIFSEAQKKDHLLQQQLMQQEQSLLLENRSLTNQLRTILETVERNILNSSYEKINDSKVNINKATNNIAWIGGSALITVIILGWIILKDLNQTQKYRLELEHLNKEKEDLLRSKTMLLATVTHDIQTPLGSVLGFTDLLQQTPLEDKQKRYIKNIQSSSEYIVKLVNDLIDFSKLENNKISITEEAFNFYELINDTCFPLLPNATNKNIQLKWNVDPELNNYFISDPERIKQVMTNLITNAIKFTQKGGVCIEATKVDDKIRIEIADSGIGIAADQIKNIFKEFRQAHSGIEKKFGGTGLGLNISKRIVELLHGEIKVDSELNRGSVFTIELPLYKASDSDLKHPKNKKQTNTAIQEILKQHTVLIIDDDKLQLQLMEEVFMPIFKKVITLNDASFAEETLSNESIDLILSDIQMPKVDGFELIGLLKDNEAFKNIPVIALSGKRDLTAEDFIELGFTSSHPKPVKIQSLIEEIITILHPDYTEEALDIEIHTDINTEVSTTQSYNTNTLKQFIGTDADAMKNILVIFIESTNENLLDLKYAAEELDTTTLSNVAHKMLPMFRQLEIGTAIALLEPLEDYTITFETATDSLAYIAKLEEEINLVLTTIKNIELS